MEKIRSVVRSAVIAGALALGVAPSVQAENLQQDTAKKVSLILSAEDYADAEFLVPLGEEQCYITLHPPKNQETYLQAISTLRNFAKVNIDSEKARKRKHVFHPGDTPVSYEKAQENLNAERKKAGDAYGNYSENLSKIRAKNPRACEKVEA